MPCSIPEHKACTKCDVDKPLTDFYKNKSTKDGHMEWCKLCVKEYQSSDRGKAVRKKTRKKNREQIRNRERLYRQSDNGKKSTKKSIEKRKQNGKTNELARRRRKNNINHRLSDNLRLRIWKALNGVNKSNSTKNLLGCSIEKFKEHISSQFLSGMNWSNYGVDWHIDHHVPCNYFDLSSTYDQQICFNYKNMKPMWSKDNIRKYDYVPEDADNKIKEIINSL